MAAEKVEWERRERKRTDEQYGKLKLLCNQKDLDFEKLDEEKSGEISGAEGKCARGLVHASCAGFEGYMRKVCKQLLACTLLQPKPSALIPESKPHVQP